MFLRFKLWLQIICLLVTRQKAWMCNTKVWGLRKWRSALKEKLKAACLSFAFNNQEQSIFCRVKHFFFWKNLDFLKIRDENRDFWKFGTKIGTFLKSSWMRDMCPNLGRCGQPAMVLSQTFWTKFTLSQGHLFGLSKLWDHTRAMFGPC